MARNSDQHRKITSQQRWVMIVVGAVLMIAPFIRYLAHGVHGWVEVAVYAAFFVAGLFLIVPDLTLKLLDKLPIPSFLKRKSEK